MTDTIVAVATPSGESALAIIRLSGNTCKKIISQCFTTPSPTPRHSYLSEYKNKQGENIDQVIMLFSCIISILKFFNLHIQLSFPEQIFHLA